MTSSAEQVSVHPEWLTPRTAELAAKRVVLEDEIKKLEDKIADPQQIKLTKSQFLNVVKTASDKMKAGTAAEKDTLCRILFLNLRVDNEKVASYLWRKPFASMVKATELSLGAPMRRYMEPYL